MKKIIIYSTDWCRYCDLAKMFLDKKGWMYEEINIEELGWNRSKLFVYFWNHIFHSYYCRISLQAVFAGCLCRLSLQAVSAGCLCRLFLKLNPLNTLESFRAAWSAWDSSYLELPCSSLGILGA